MAGLSHALGAVLAMGCLGYFLARAHALGSEKHFWVALVFSGSMFCLYAASALYHCLHLGPAATFRMRQLDHASIYLFIAGCYTPFCILVIREDFARWVCLAVWIFAAAGVAAKFIWFEGSRWLRVTPYLVMSWLGLMLGPAIGRAFAPEGMRWLGYEGAAYSVGALIYAAKRPDPWPRAFGFHEIWHVLVLVGTLCHVRAVMYVY